MKYIAINRIERRPHKGKPAEITNPGETLDVSGDEAEELLGMGAIAKPEAAEDTETPPKETAAEKRARKAAEKKAAEEAAADDGSMPPADDAEGLL